MGRALIAILLAVAPEPSGRVVLSPSLALWKAQLQGSGRLIVLAKVYSVNGELRLPADTEQRTAVAHILGEPAIAAQFAKMHAMTVNLQSYGRRASFILVNMARENEWQGFEDVIIAHEFGHIDLHVRGYRSPGVGPGTPLCEAMHTGDIVQHILIRREMTQRGIDYVPWMAGTLSPLIDRLRVPGPAPGNRCDQLAKLSMWLDASLGLTPEDWPRLPEFLDLMEQSYPELAQVASDLHDRLGAMDVADRAGYKAALKLAAGALPLTSSR